MIGTRMKIEQILADDENRRSASTAIIRHFVHDVNYAMAWADDVFLFKDGKVLIHGTPEQVFSNKSALASTNLEQPACLQLFDSLCKKGILKTSLPIPHSLQKLESYIAAISERTYHGGKIMQESKKALKLGDNMFPLSMNCFKSMLLLSL